MEPTTTKLAKVWTYDSELLGLAQRLFHRNEGVEPDLLLFKSYLEVENYQLGATYFVPTDFIDHGRVEDGGLWLVSSFREVLERTWARMPVFVARGDGIEESLPES
jgi:hypothetical protein